MKFTPSVNIERDFENEIEYIVTPNSKSVFNQLINNFHSGIHSFNIIGSYGTGKSSFLLALEKNLKKEKIYFAPPNGQFNGLSDFEFVNIVGKYTSLEKLLCDKLLLKSDVTNVIAKFEDYYLRLSREKKFLILVIDEFGKVLEFAANNNPEKELYFIQQFSELVNNPKFNILFITTLHQNFKAYSNKLSPVQQNEWDKVKGRFKEIAFNEPVEQLLYLAAEKIKTQNFDIKDRKRFEKLYNLIIHSRILSVSESIDKHVAENLYPIDLLSASILTLALQRYGQNERSLFTFLEANENHSITDFDINKHPIFNLCDVFNYLIFNYYTFINTKYNPDNRQWASINNAIDKVESNLNEYATDAIKIIKSVGLINIYTTNRGVIDKNFLINYSLLALNIENAKDIIEVLERFKIIKYAKHKSKYVFIEGTDVDIELEIFEAGANIQKSKDITEKVKQYIDLPYIPARSIHIEKGTPRFFEFRIANKPLNEIPQGEIDGFINLIFNENISEEFLIEQSFNCQEAILFVMYKNTAEIVDTIFEIDKINFVLENIDKADKIAVKELLDIKNVEIKKLNSLVVDNLFKNSNQIKWIFKGEIIEINNSTQLNRFLSHVCSTIYFTAPIFKNEMVNKQKYSSAIASARKNYFNQLFEYWNFKDLKIEPDKFPPEKTIYLSLLKNTGIHRKENAEYTLSKPTDESFIELWNTSVEFIESAKIKNRSITEFIDILKAKPFKLKQGFIDFWVPTFLFIKREDYALFSNNAFIPNLNIDIIDFITKKSDDFSIKTFDISGIKLDIFNKYRELINLESQEKADKSSFY
jgi:DNA replication protein DnaC